MKPYLCLHYYHAGGPWFVIGFQPHELTVADRIKHIKETKPEKGHASRLRAIRKVPWSEIPPDLRKRIQGLIADWQKAHDDRRKAEDDLKAALNSTEMMVLYHQLVPDSAEFWNADLKKLIGTEDE